MRRSIGMPSIDSVVRQIEARGYDVVIHRLGDRVELHATPVGGHRELHVARCEGDDIDSTLQCAIELAKMIGIEVED